MKQVRFLLEYLLVLFFYYPVRFLPHRILFPLSASIGWFLYFVPSFRKLTTANVAVAFPEKNSKEIRTIARASISNFVLTVLEFCWFSDRPDLLDAHFNKLSEDVQRMIKDNQEKKKGFVWVVPHLGNWELAGLKFKHDTEIPFAVVVRKIRNPYISKIINGNRSSEGANVILARGSVRETIKALKEGYVVATLIDQNTKIRAGGVFVEFFGLPVPSSRAPALFAKKINVPLYVAGCWRVGRRYQFFVEPLPKPINEYSDDREIIQDLMKLNEELIRQKPDQYLWWYKRFQNIPKDADLELQKKYPFYSKVVTERFYDDRAPKP